MHKLLKFIQSANPADYTMKVFSLVLRRPSDSLKNNSVMVKRIDGCPLESLNDNCRVQQVKTI
jgi:hypothetical protein